MSNSCRTTLFRIATVVYIVAVAYLCFNNFQHLPKVPRRIWGLETDKVVHFCMFFPFPILFYLSYGRKPSSLWESFGRLVNVTSYGVIFAGLTEIVQSALKWRSKDILDFRADVLAISISAAVLLVFIIIGRIHSRK